MVVSKFVMVGREGLGVKYVCEETTKRSSSTPAVKPPG